MLNPRFLFGAALFVAWTCLFLAGAAAQFPAGLTYVDANSTNTAAVAGGGPNPFFISTTPANDNRWLFRAGFGFDVAGNNGVFEKNGPNSAGDAVQLVTTISGLTPGRVYGIHVCYLSATSAAEQWQINAGLAPAALSLFTRTTPAAQIQNIGLSSEVGSNRTQLIGALGNQTADASGQIRVWIDDTPNSGANLRTWFDGVAYGPPAPDPDAGLPPGAVQLASDGAWTWFNGEAVIVHGGAVYCGYVKSNGRSAVVRFDPATRTKSEAELSTATSEQLDDHNNPGIAVRADGRLLAIYAKHSTEAKFYHRISNNTAPATLSDWGAEQSFATPANATYANVFRLPGDGGKIHNFFRCIGFDPTLTTSADGGATWSPPVQVINSGTSSVRPYPRYISNGNDRIDFIYTDGHPRDQANSIFHLHFKNSEFRASNGTLVKTLAGLPIQHDSGERGTVIYQYSTSPSADPNAWIPSGRGWTWDIHYGADGNPLCVFTVQVDDVTGTGWNHDRIYYYYARWTGSAWQKRFIAQAGRPLYSVEDDYAGGICLDPDDPNVVYLSTNAASPFDLSSTTSVPLAPNARYEIHRGVTRDGGLTFTWAPMTQNSTQDNLRPFVPVGHGRRHAVTWFRGTYTTYTNFTTRVMALYRDTPIAYADWAQDYGLAAGTGTADTEQDEATNLEEYVFGGDPLESDQPVSQAATADGAYALALPAKREDVRVTIAFSPDMNGWLDVAQMTGTGALVLLPDGSAGGFTVAEESGAGIVLTVTPPSAHPKGFFRARISLLPAAPAAIPSPNVITRGTPNDPTAG